MWDRGLRWCGTGLSGQGARGTPRRVRLFVDPREDGRSVQALLTDRGGLPLAVFDDVLRSGGVTLNRQRVRDPSLTVHPRDEVVAHVLARGASASGPALLDAGRILFQDDDLIAVDKPAGVAAQGTEVDADGGLDAAVRALLLRGGTPAPFVGLVHRLDLETSGVTILARSQSALTALSRQFREGSVRKRYVALVSGVPSWQEKTVEGPIGADRHRRGAFTVSSHGRPASSAFTVLERHGNPGEIGAYAKVQVLPRTGRTHQIRVHASAMGHPLLGDRRYGGPDALTTAIGERVEVPRVALHAMELWCVHPNGTDLHLSAPWPADLSAFERRWAGTPTQTL